MAQSCTCLDVHGEDPQCPEHGVDAVLGRLANLECPDDPAIGCDAYDVIQYLMERLERKEGS